MPERAGDWSSDREDVTQFILEADSGDMGQWTRRLYTRESPGAAVEANLMEGPGPGPLRIPESVGSYDAVMEAKSEYRILEVAGRRAVLERGPLLPLALTVSLGKNRTLTLEGHVTEEELTGLAVQFIGILDNMANTENLEER